MAQKYRLVKAEGFENRSSSTSKQDSQLQEREYSSTGSKVHQRARFWRSFALFLVGAGVMVALFVWLHGLSGSMVQVKHALHQQALASAKQQGQLTQVQTTLNHIPNQLTAFENQVQNEFARLWTAISHSH